jgi:hypothetical protein
VCQKTGIATNGRFSRKPQCELPTRLPTLSVNAARERSSEITLEDVGLLTRLNANYTKRFHSDGVASRVRESEWRKTKTIGQRLSMQELSI